MHRRARIQAQILGLVAAVLLASAGPVMATETGATRLDMQLRDGRLSAHVVDAPFAAILTEIASLVGAGVTGIDPTDVAPTTISFRDLPVEEALERALKGRNHLLVYGSDARGAYVRRIVLLNGRGTDLAPMERAADLASAVPDQAQRAESGPDQVDPVLAEALDLLASGLALGDPEIRRQLLDEVATWKLDSQSRAVLLARLSADPEPEVREAALQVLQAGRAEVSSTLGIRDHAHGSPTRRAGRSQGA